MPIRLLDSDIMEFKCDAIVIPVYLDGCSQTTTKVLGPTSNPSKYIIEATTPPLDKDYFSDLSVDNYHKMSNFYDTCFSTIKKLNCKSVAFPLMYEDRYSSYNLVKEEQKFLYTFSRKKEINIYIFVKNKFGYYIDNEYGLHNFFLKVHDKNYNSLLDYQLNNYILQNQEKLERFINRKWNLEERFFYTLIEYSPFSASRSSCAQSMSMDILMPHIDFEDLDQKIKQLDMSFSETLFYLIDKKQLPEVECYKRANVDRKTFSKIKCNKNYRPSKTTALSFAFSLKLTYEETQELLSTAGLTLSRSSVFDVIITFCLVKGEFSVNDVNEILFRYDQPLLG